LWSGALFTPSAFWSDLGPGTVVFHVGLNSQTQAFEVCNTLKAFSAQTVTFKKGRDQGGQDPKNQDDTCELEQREG